MPDSYNKAACYSQGSACQLIQPVFTFFFGALRLRCGQHFSGIVYMLIVLPLLTALSAAPALANSYSSSDKRTLQSAISSALHSAEINRFYVQCKEPFQDGEARITRRDKEQSRMLALLQQKVHTQNIDLLLMVDARLSQTVKSSIVTWNDCADKKAFQTLQDNYEVALFSLDIAIPLERAISTHKAPAKSRSEITKTAVQQLIARSHAVALVNVIDKQQLNAVQQANHLHPDYNGRYIFKVQHGWRSNVSHYLGMHIFVRDNDIDKTAKQWLVFLDKNGHFIKSIEANKAQPYLAALKDAEWRYDVHGNLHRN